MHLAQIISVRVIRSLVVGVVFAGVGLGLHRKNAPEARHGLNVMSLMRSVLYLVRHAQSRRIVEPSSAWPLSPVGAEQAARLADLLIPLRIQKLFSSPFFRSRATADPLARKLGLEVVILDGLRERILMSPDGCDPGSLWANSWDDFSFSTPNCESSWEAQRRICEAVRSVADAGGGVNAVFTDGHVLSLFLNTLDARFHRKEAEALRNPDVVKVEWVGGVPVWHRQFCLPGLDAIATTHSDTP